MRQRTAPLAIALALTAGCAAPVPPGPSTAPRTALAPDAGPPALAAITETELRRDVFAMSSDAMRGREAGELDEMRASVWVAERAREAGLLPAGDDGTYFQFWPL
ncbi:MAG TPA: hypothetical protein VF625_07715, partial [Longimicrobium sp.]